MATIYTAIPEEFRRADQLVGVIRELQWSDLEPEERVEALRLWLMRVGREPADWMFTLVRREYNPDQESYEVG